MVFDCGVERLAAEESVMTQCRLCWEYLLPDEPGFRILRVGNSLVPAGLAVRGADFDGLVIENLNVFNLRRGSLQKLEKLLEAKKWVFISFRGYNSRVIPALERNGFKINELYWVYRKKESRMFWLITLLNPGAFFFSCSSILSIMADDSLMLKKALLRILFKAGILKYFIESFLIAKKVAGNTR